MNENNGVYIPPDIVPNRFIHFAVDNVVFSEDTPDGKKTLHGTIINVYQQSEENDLSIPLDIHNATERSLKTLPAYFISLVLCPMLRKWKTCCLIPQINTAGSNHL